MSIADTIRAMEKAGVSQDKILLTIKVLDDEAQAIKREATRQRVIKHRANKSLENNGHVTHVTVTDVTSLLPNGVPLDGFPTPLPLTPLPLPSSHKENTPKGVQKKKPKVEIPAWMPMQDWNDWIEMRQRKRANPTNRALEITIKKLTEWKAKGHDPGAILQTSIERGYTGVFEPKPELTRQTRYPAEPKRNVTNLMETR